MHTLLPSIALLMAPVGVDVGATVAGDDGEFPFAKAPDDHRGFGAPMPADVRRLFQKAEEGDVAFLSHLLSLESEIRLLLELCEARYARLGYFAVFTVQPDGLDELHLRFRGLQRNPFGEAMDESRARAFARMFVDERFHVRMRLIGSWRDDARELRGALNLFRAHSRGKADLQEGQELAGIARRADFAASRLRQLLLDLELLHQPPVGPVDRRDSLEVDRAVEYLTHADASGRGLLRDLAGARDRAVDRMWSSLFTPRFDDRHAAALERRRRDRQRAVEVHRELLELLPNTEQGQRAGGAIAAMDAAARYRKAIQTGTEGLARDPFHPEIHYLLGVASDFLAGRHTSGVYFDRFLSLRGIRFYEYASYGSRDLDALEEYALLVVADWRPPPKPEDR